MSRALSFGLRLIRLILTPWRIPKALFIRLRYVLRRLVGLPGDFEYQQAISATIDRAVQAVPTASSNPGVTASDLDPLSLRIERLEAVAHFQRLRPLHAGDPPAPHTRISLLIDLRITQSDQRERGISRYTTALALTLPTLLPPGAVSYLTDPDRPPPNDIEALRCLGRVVNGAAEIAQLDCVSHFLQACLFDLSKRVEELFPAELARFQPKLCAILYDIIPWLFREQYLTSDFIFQRYAYQFSLLWRLDKLYAISDSARRDAIEAAHLPAHRVETIFGGIDETRWPDALPPASPDPSQAAVTLENRDGERFTLRAPYWVYVGGDDFRKNVEGAIAAFALAKQTLAPEIQPQLVIACALPKERRAHLSGFAAERGLTMGEDVVVTGFISDADLAAAYRGAFATVFPSLYEGLGLPIIESYHFNKPALAGDNSSLTELTHPDCRFDSSDPADIARAVAALHRDPALGEASLAYGRAILERYNWRNAAAAIARDVCAGREADLILTKD